ncbi:MAG: DUF2817 domain-containing protein [Leptospira sp.]|nr:DUF2817 domain-containing protein [Leptospira sp.]
MQDHPHLRYFHETYQASRSGFRNLLPKLQEINPRTKIGFITIPSSLDTDLTIDYFQLPSLKKTKSTLIITSGMHGVECAAGAAVQRNFLSEIYSSQINLDYTSVLVIHSINPFGFKYNRRVTENNVDLNRNFLKNRKGFQRFNEGYPKVFEFLNPKVSLHSKSFSSRLFLMKALWTIIKMGIPAIKQASLQGQYHYPEGIYFGGTNYEPLRKPLGKLIRNFAKKSPRVLLVDIHTGYGERGKLHFFPSDPKKPRFKKYTEEIFEGYKIDWASDEEFFTVTGDLCTYVYKILPKKCEIIPMVFEYGTLNSQSTLGAIESMKRLIRENQGYHYGYKNHEERLIMTAKFLEMFHPSDPEWRIKVIEDTINVWKKILPRLQKY